MAAETKRITLALMLLWLTSALAACNGSDGATGAQGEPGEPAGPVIANLSVLGSPIHPGGQAQVFISAYSPTDQPLSYSWHIPAGWGGTDSGSNLVVLTAPEEQAATALVGVTVSDGVRTREAQVMLATRGPAIEALSVAGNEPLAPGDLLGVSVTAYNRDGEPLSYDYNLGGLSVEPAAPEWSWVSTAAMSGIYRLTSTVKDGNDLTASASLDLQLQGISPWPAFGGDRHHTRRSASAGATVGEGTVRWAVTTGGPMYASPVIGPDGTVYIGSLDKNVYALDPDDGSEIWSFLAGSAVRGSLAVGADGTVYAGSSDGTVYALDPDDGSELWSQPHGIGAAVFSLALGAGGTLYVGSINGTVYALNPDNGSEIWSFATHSAVRSTPAQGADGTLYIGSTNGKTYALNPEDGSERWSFNSDSVHSSPAVGADGTVYVGSYNGKVYALNPDDGSEIWSFTTAGSVGESSPAIGADGTVYIGSYDKKVYALNPDDGSEIWSFTTGYLLRSSPAIGADGTVYIASSDQQLYALDPSDGSEIWSVTTGEAVESSPAIGADGTVYIGSLGGTIYAIQ
ncbi:cell surface protein [Isoalcanivorax pacificus W11-5]|uniref:Cell surface protein n=1 Tax=Isoalcanivorax pacificus W11-5 TaxID=391936 RepID=A0A0B4XK30_9GAMM|nr:PQQ-binding-like beta-propeller repeat protein [Isoalcanivorax pacificus]AJD47431.1 cell surface protein [Isoalcanivorax pacificus W11-5]